jgi:aldehyde dehydrogenase (NAD+)
LEKQPIHQYQDTLLTSSATDRIVRYDPVGVAAGIASWNATFLYVGWKIAPAIAAGCTFIFKSSEKSPLGAIAVAELFKEAGFPPGVVNFVSGARLTGELLASHPHINKISFTGSIPVGKQVQIAATKSNLKRVTLEMGGKSPGIVFADADLSMAIPAIAAFLFNSGQVCVASSRLMIEESIAPVIIEQIKGIFSGAAAGLDVNPSDPSAQFGPLVDKIQYEKVLNYISTAKDSSGAELVTGGKAHSDKGFGIDPTM